MNTGVALRIDLFGGTRGFRMSSQLFAAVRRELARRLPLGYGEGVASVDAAEIGVSNWSGERPQSFTIGGLFRLGMLVMGSRAKGTARSAGAPSVRQPSFGCPPQLALGGAVPHRQWSTVMNTPCTQIPFALDQRELSYIVSKHLPELRARGLTVTTAYGEFHLDASTAASAIDEIGRAVAQLLASTRAAGGAV